MDKKKYTNREVKYLAKNYAQYLRDTHHVPIQGVYVFGSYAKREARNWSDIDVCVVSPVFEYEDRLSFLWKKRRSEDIDAMIAPVGFSPDDFRGGDINPLLHEIKTTGVRVNI